MSRASSGRRDAAAAPATGAGRGPADVLAVVFLAAAAAELLLHTLGTPLGEPFADDFFFLRRVLFAGPHPWLDGAGSPVYWRPLGRQAYYGALGETVVSHPAWIAALHLLALFGASVLLYRALRPRVPAATAAVAAAFPLWLESARMLVSWPSHFQDVGALFFAALAVHEASRRRLAPMLGALLASFLCKEVGAVTALLVPWWPAAGADRRWRVRATLGVVAVTGAWAATYAWIATHGGAGFAHEFGENAAAAGTPLVTRGWWALTHVARAAFSLPATPGPLDLLVVATLLALTLGAGLALVARPVARERLRGVAPLAAWGAAWFVAASLPLAEVYPSWSAQRAVFASVGLGLSLAALLAAASPWLLAPLVALRLVTFLASPGAVGAVTALPAEAGGEFDFRHFSRLQSFTRETRDLLHERLPRLPAGAAIGDHNLPQLTRHTYAGDRALQVWYRDTTLRWVPFEEFRRAPTQPVAAFVEYQPHGAHALALVEGSAMRMLFSAGDAMRSGRFTDALDSLDRAGEVQSDTSAAVFLGTLSAKRAVCLAALGRRDDAERAAREGLERWPENPDSRVTLAEFRVADRRYASAETLLVEQLRRYPADEQARVLLARARAEWAAGRER